MTPNQTETKSTIRTFALATFLNDLGSDMIYPLWPVFVTTVLKANMAVLGLLDGIGEGLAPISKAVSGYLSDRWERRKVFIWTGYLFAAFSRFGYSISSVWTHLIPFRILDRIGKERSAPRDALVADISTPENRGRHFGFLRSMDHLGGVCGVLICILLFKVLGYRILFALAAVPSFISAILVFSFIKEKKPALTPCHPGISLRSLSRNFRLFLASNAIYAFGAFSYSFLLLYANKMGFHVTFVPVLYLIMTASASLASLIFGRVSDKIGRKPVLFLSYFLWFAVCMNFILSSSRIIILVSFVLYGAHKGILIPIRRTIVSELAPFDFRASCLGGFQMILGLCALPASFIAGILWEQFGMIIPFYLSMTLTLISSLVLIFTKTNWVRPSEE